MLILQSIQIIAMLILAALKWFPRYAG